MSRTQEWFVNRPSRGLAGAMAILALWVGVIGIAPAARVAAQELAAPMINEYLIDHIGTDAYEFVEIFGTPNTDYSNYRILEIEGDLGTSGGALTAPGLIDGVYTVGTTDAEGLWFTGFLPSNALENGTVTLLLVSGFTGAEGNDLDTNDDGTLDVTPWTAIVDAVAITDANSTNSGGGTNYSYGTPILLFNYDGGLFPISSGSRIPNGTDTDATGDWVRNDFNLEGIPGQTGTLMPGEALNTPGAENALNYIEDPVINEYIIDHIGTDAYEFVEIFGTPNNDYSDYTILEIEGDLGTSGGALTAPGLIDGVYAVGTTDAEGLWFTGFLPSNALENGTVTLLLVEDFTGAEGNDLDTNNDGTLDVTPWSTIVDAVAITDANSTNSGGGTNYSYGTPILLFNYDGGLFPVSGGSRIPNGTDTDATGDWMRNDFNLEGIPGQTGTLMPGEAVNTPGDINSASLPDNLPTVASTTPADNATEVADDANIIITFSEAVTVTDSWFTISCTTSGTVTAVVSGGATSYTLNPAADFALGETCTVTVVAAQVVDQDGTSNAMAADYVFDFTVTAVGVCTTAFTPIYTLQENGANFGAAGSFTVEGIVTGDFQNDSQLDGFFLQAAAGGDANAMTSDGIFVFDDQPILLDVVIGQRVRVTGTVSEFTPAGASASQTRITATAITDCEDTGSITPVPVTLPFATTDFAERYESMKVYMPQTLYVTEVFTVGRFGQVTVSAGGRLENPTNAVMPGFQANALQDANNLNKIVIDDGGQRQNPDPIPYIFGADPTIRIGDRTSMVVGVLTYMDATPDTNTSTEVIGYRVHPTTAPTFVHSNPRPTAPPNTGDLRVISFNVLNYFNGDGLGGGFPTERGANNLAEFERQSDKIVAAIHQLDPDVAGLIEIENDAGANGAMAELVERLNDVAGAGTYAYVETGAIGTDAIKVGFIYKPAAVMTIGAAMVDLDAVNNRPTVAQLFEQIGTGARFNAVVNHFKSKGCGGETGLDLDLGDGQGCFNNTRLMQAERLDTFIQTMVIPNSGDTDVLILGDLNSYMYEDPIIALTDAGYVNLTTAYIDEPYSYVFDGQSGTLDHALGTASLAGQVHDVTEWHINTDEPSVLDYNTEFKTAGQNALNVGTPYRSSDHDPIVVDLGTLTPSVGLLNVQLTLQGRTEPAPHASRVVNVNVQIMPEGGGVAFYNENLTTSDSSTFTLVSLDPGTYLFSFKGEHTLARQMTITIAAGVNDVTTEPLLEGDANGDNQVTISDFSILATAFGTSQGEGGYDARADFNDDTVIGIGDFSLLASNFGVTGDGGVIAP